MHAVKQLFTRYKMLALLIAVALIWLFFSWQTEGGFVTPRNLSNLLRQMSITGILACGMVLVIGEGRLRGDFPNENLTQERVLDAALGTTERAVAQAREHF